MSKPTTLAERLTRLRNRFARVGAFCICGEYTTKCQYHKPDANPVEQRAADLAAVLDEHHELDYDSCTTDTDQVVADIAEVLLAERERVLVALRGDLNLIQDRLTRNPQGDDPFLVPSGQIDRAEVYRVIERRRVKETDRE